MQFSSNILNFWYLIKINTVRTELSPYLLFAPALGRHGRHEPQASDRRTGVRNAEKRVDVGQSGQEIRTPDAQPAHHALFARENAVAVAEVKTRTYY